jgi:hypothetical protein
MTLVLSSGLKSVKSGTCYNAGSHYGLEGAKVIFLYPLIVV